MIGKMAIHFSSKTTEWQTPRAFFQAIDTEFELNTDVCATNQNKMCKKFFSKKEDGLKQDWFGRRCWLNPPYGREIGKWVEKAATGGRILLWPYFPRAPTQNGSTTISTKNPKFAFCAVV